MTHPPLRLRILQALTEVLKEIEPSGGYYTDLNRQVYRGRAVFGDNDPLPFVSILEESTPVEPLPPPGNGGLSSGKWGLVLQGFVQDDPDHPTDPAHFLMADVKRRLAIESRKALQREPMKGILNMGKSVTGLRMGSGTVRPPDEISSVAWFWLGIELDIIENLTCPHEL